MISRPLFLLFVCCAAAAWAEPTKDQRSFTATYENDVFNGQDNGYTNGVRFAWTSPEEGLPQIVDVLEKRLVDPFTGLVPLFPVDGGRRFSYAIGQSMFTPSDIRTANPDPRDRPYAGWLYGSVGLTADTGNALDSLDLTLGVVGPLSHAEQTQKFIHEHVTGSPRPMGWNYQLKNEPGIVLTYEHKWRKFYESKSFFGLGIDFTPHADASLGNVFTLASVGGTLRIGQHIPDDYGPPRIRPSIGGSDFFSSSSDFGWYLFAGTEGRAVARNIFLDGNTFADSRSVDKEYFVADFQAGAAVFYKNVRLSFTTVYRTDEFKHQQTNDRFGVLALTINY